MIDRYKYYLKWMNVTMVNFLKDNYDYLKCFFNNKVNYEDLEKFFGHKYHKEIEKIEDCLKIDSIEGVSECSDVC